MNDKLGQQYISNYGEFIATAEDDATLIAMRDLEQFIGREITWVRGNSFDDVIDRGTKTRLPSWARRYCTEEMKLLPIFLWWFNSIGEKCDMRIGFRFDEFGRMERFFNNSDPTNFSIPTSCKTYGNKQQKHENFNWRNCSFPLIRDGVTKPDINAYWIKKGIIPATLFTPEKKIEFPIISNCVGCFHKKPETLCVMHNMHPEKMNWFSRQEDKGMGTWLDSKIPYSQLSSISDTFIPEMIRESCDSGGCTD